MHHLRHLKIDCRLFAHEIPDGPQILAMGNAWPNLETLILDLDSPSELEPGLGLEDLAYFAQAFGPTLQILALCLDSEFRSNVNDVTGFNLPNLERLAVGTLEAPELTEDDEENIAFFIDRLCPYAWVVPNIENQDFRENSQWSRIVGIMDELVETEEGVERQRNPQ